MPKERLNISADAERMGPAEVFVNLRDLISLQFQARGFSFLPKYAVQTILSGRHRSKLRGRGLDFDEVRKYVSGDDIRNIDWRVTARVGKTHTKVYTEEKERPVFLVVDQSASMFFGSQVYFKSVIAAQLAAVGCWRVIDQGDRVGGLVFNDHRIDHVAPKRDRRSVQRFLSFIATQNNELGSAAQKDLLEHPLNQSLHRAAQLVTHDFLVVLISDLYEANHETLKQLIRIKRNNDVIVARISDPAERELPAHNLTLGDGEFQLRLDKDPGFRQRYTREWDQRQAEIQAGFKKYGIPYVQLNTMEEAAVQLRDALNVRRRTSK